MEGRSSCEAVELRPGGVRTLPRCAGCGRRASAGRRRAEGTPLGAGLTRLVLVRVKGGVAGESGPLTRTGRVP